MNIILTEPALDRDRHVHTNMAVAGVQIHIRGEITWQLQTDTAIASTQVPTRSGSRAGQRSSIDAAVSAADIQSIKSSRDANASITGVSSQRSIHSIDF